MITNAQLQLSDMPRQNQISLAQQNKRASILMPVSKKHNRGLGVAAAYPIERSQPHQAYYYAGWLGHQFNALQFADKKRVSQLTGRG